MASNSFGNLLTITTWGESHGPAMGVVIDGVPAGLTLNVNDINQALAARAPGKTPYTSPRREPDKAEILSGVFEHQTTGAPISVMIPNQDVDSSKYEPIKDLLRPGHANYTYQQKYGVYDYRGGGRASARETVCRVAAGAVADALLKHFNIEVQAYLYQVQHHHCPQNESHDYSNDAIYNSPIFCPEPETEHAMMNAIESAKAEGDSLGGTVQFVARGLPIGLGDPVYEKLEAQLAKAMMSLPASKGFEMGEGFHAVTMTGSEHNDCFQADPTKPLQTNHAGGTLGGISTGEPLVGRVAFKPTSSIQRAQNTIDHEGVAQTFALPEGSRHDPCVAIRAVPVVSAMVKLVLADALLMHRATQLSLE